VKHIKFQVEDSWTIGESKLLAAISNP